MFRGKDKKPRKSGSGKYKRTVEIRVKISVSLTGIPHSPEHIAAEKEAQNRLDVKARKSVSAIKNWQNPDYVIKQQKAIHNSPNGTEKFLDNLLQQLLPGEYEFVGNFKFRLAGKWPDFVNKKQKKIIEFYGHHHKLEDEQKRIDLFAKEGYQTLVIWYCELKNLKKLIKKILNFNLV